MPVGSGLIIQSRSEIVAGASSVYRRDATKLNSLGSTALSKNLADQFMYGNASAGSRNEFFNYSGMGYGGAPEGLNNFFNWQNFTDPLWVVPKEQPRVKLWLVEEEGKTGGPEETLRTGEVNEKVQKLFESVPLPTLSLIPKGQIQSIGSDRDAHVWCPATDELWEIHRLGKFLQGPHQGEWKFGYGHYQTEASKWNGVRQGQTGTLSGSALSLIHGVITMQDLARIQRGGQLEHAIGIAVLARLNEHIPPAVENDHGENTYEFLADGTTPNPAHGNIDAVPEGLRVVFPYNSRAREYGLTRRFEIAIYEAVREYGIIVRDGCGAGTVWPLEDLRTLYTRYCSTIFDPTFGNSKFEKYAHSSVPEELWRSYQDSSLTEFEGELNGTEGVLSRMPWRTLEQLEPRAG